MARGRLLQGDCLAVLPTLADGSVDMVFADLPYGITDNPWDCAIPLDRLWPELRRVGKPSCVFVFAAALRFAASLIQAQPRLFRYDLVWDKKNCVGFLNAKKQPLRRHELICVFASGAPLYRPQFTPGVPYGHKGVRPQSPSYTTQDSSDYSANLTGQRYPTSLITHHSVRRGSMHPTQKPVALLRWLIATYSRPGDLVLDPTSGVASTAVAALREGRRFVCIERDAGYYAKGCERVRAELVQGELPLPPQARGPSPLHTDGPAVGADLLSPATGLLEGAVAAGAPARRRRPAVGPVLSPLLVSAGDRGGGAREAAQGVAAPVNDARLAVEAEARGRGHEGAVVAVDAGAQGAEGAVLGGVDGLAIGAVDAGDVGHLHRPPVGDVE